MTLNGVMARLLLDRASSGRLTVGSRNLSSTIAPILVAKNHFGCLQTTHGSRLHERREVLIPPPFSSLQKGAPHSFPGPCVMIFPMKLCSGTNNETLNRGICRYPSFFCAFLCIETQPRLIFDFRPFFAHFSFSLLPTSLSAYNLLAFPFFSLSLESCLRVCLLLSPLCLTSSADLIRLVFCISCSLPSMH